MTAGEKLRRVIVWLPVVSVCAWAGGWLAAIFFPQGMGFGTPLAERVDMVFRPSANPPEVFVVNAVMAVSLLLADVVTPKSARAVLLCLSGLFAGGLYYELFLGNYIDTLFAHWPPFVGEAAALCSLLVPHTSIIVAKLTVRSLRVPKRTLPSSQEAM